MTTTQDPTAMTLTQLRAELLTEYGFGSRLKLAQARAHVIKARQLVEAARLANTPQPKETPVMPNTKTPADPRPAELLIGTCPTCSTPRSAFARSPRGLECGSCGFFNTHRDVVLVTGSPLKVVR